MPTVRFPQDFGERETVAAGVGSEPQTLREKHQYLRLGGQIKVDSWLAQYIFHPRFETFGGCVVLFNFLILTMETHATATDDDSVMNIVKVVNLLLLLYYTAESAVRLYVMKMGFFRYGWNNLDVVIIVTGWLSEFLEALQVDGGSMEQISMLKSLRMLRLLRLVRLLVAFRELYVLVAGMGRCMKTLFWASGLIFMVLNAWAILSVEYLDLKVKELTLTGAYSTCSWCQHAFANIWQANLTWFQIISTADWATIGRPLAEYSAWTYIFFVVNVFVVMWGLLNLIVAAIVDANIAAREDDVAIAAKMAARTQQEAWRSFASLCEEMDQDGSGDISISEFKEFWKSNVELQQHLTIMGVQEKDMDRLLQVMDEDGSGCLEHKEFIEQFTQMRTLVEKTTLYFLLKFVQSMQTSIFQQGDLIQKICKNIEDVRDSCCIPIPQMPAAQPENKAAVAPTEMQPNGSATVPITMPMLKVLPPGWYYFGKSLPPEAVAWCKDLDATCEAIGAHQERPSTRRAVVVKEDISKLPANKGRLAPSGQHWEPVPPPNCMPVSGSPCMDCPRDAPREEPHGAEQGVYQSQASASSVQSSQERHDESQDDLARKHGQGHASISLCADDARSIHAPPSDQKSEIIEHLS